MKKSPKVVGLASLLVGIPGCLYADRAHDLAAVAGQQKPVTGTGCKPATLNTQTCHTRFPTGCTDSAHKYDAYLNFLKNQTPGGSLASSADLGDANFKTLEGKIPKGLSISNHAKSAPALANLGEGNIFTVIAYLYFVEDTGSGSSPNKEITNCKLALPGSFDFHIGLGFDSALAATIRATKPRPVFGSPGEMDKTSVVSEMTPRTGGPKVTFPPVKCLLGHLVNVERKAIFDNEQLQA